VELAVLSDMLRQRVFELEGGSDKINRLVGADVATVARMSSELSSAKFSLHESQRKQHHLEGDIAGLEAELSDDRELLDLAALRGGIGIAEAIRRNKWLKETVRSSEKEIENYRAALTVRCGFQTYNLLNPRRI